MQIEHLSKYKTILRYNNSMQCNIIIVKQFYKKIRIFRQYLEKGQSEISTYYRFQDLWDIF